MKKVRERGGGNEMTDREKALETLTATLQMLDTVPMDKQNIEGVKWRLQTVRSAFSSPSFDDAMKVVEEEINKFVYERARDSFDNYIEIEEDSVFKIVKPVLDRIRTALRERGEWKR